jgi:hypothetical protein
VGVICTRRVIAAAGARIFAPLLINRNRLLGDLRFTPVLVRCGRSSGNGPVLRCRARRALILCAASGLAITTVACVRNWRA